MTLFLAAAIPALLLASAAPGQVEVPRIGAPATISYTSLGGLFREFVALPDGSGVYLRDKGNRWYFARFESKCEALPRAPFMGFQRTREMRIAPGTMISFPRDGVTGKCRIAELTYSDSPPAGMRRSIPPYAGPYFNSGSVGMSDSREGRRGATLR